jgi:hypothetical protein
MFDLGLLKQTTKNLSSFFILRKKNRPMKKLLFLFLLTSCIYAQKEVFNVQKYCIDAKPFKKGQCDISGNEYSFVFLDTQKKEVIFFFTNVKIKYKILETQPETKNKNEISYSLANDKGVTEMKINNQKTKIEFLDATNHIYLTVGKSKKSL